MRPWQSVPAHRAAGTVGGGRLSQAVRVDGAGEGGTRVDLAIEVKRHRACPRIGSGAGTVGGGRLPWECTWTVRVRGHRVDLALQVKEDRACPRIGRPGQEVAGGFASECTCRIGSRDGGWREAFPGSARGRCG
jgi:hypothetical protein